MTPEATYLLDVPETAAPGRAVPAGSCCANCGQAMQQLTLAGQGGRTVQVELCGRCHQVWFTGEADIPLAGRGLLALLRAMQLAQCGRHERLRGYPACPRCGERLLWQRDQSRPGPGARHACPQGHGALQSFGLFLADHGFVRRMQRPELALLRLRSGGQPWHCINCGMAARAREGEACEHCGAVPRVLDLQQMVRALARRRGVGSLWRTPHASAARRCAQCSATLDPLHDARCLQCGLAVAVTDLGEALRLLEPVAKVVEAGSEAVAHPLQRLAHMHNDAPGPARPGARFGWRGMRRGAWWLLAAVLALSGLALVWRAGRWFL